MGLLNKYIEVSKGWTGKTEKFEVEYDFAVDGGAIGILDILKVDAASVIKNFFMKVDAAVTSSGATTLDVGIKGGDTNALVAAMVKASLGLGVVAKDKTNEILPLKLAANDVIAMEIAAFAFTAGKIRFCFEIENF